MKRLSIKNILVPIDFSKLSVEAIAIAKWLAQRFGATIHLTHVHQWQYPADFMGPVMSSEFLPEERQDKHLAEELKSIANKAGLSSRDQTHLRKGISAFHEICNLAREISADLIVLPTHGYTGLKHVFLGSTAERVVQHAPCPIFVVRQAGKRSAKESPDYKKILVPVDFSGCSQKGLQYAIGFANELGAEITLLYATYLGYVYSCVGTALYDIPGLQAAARKNAQRQMRKLVQAADFGRVKFETVFTEGSPVLDICDFAKSQDVDLIISSTHGLTGFEHALIGSIAEKVVRHAPCSILVVPSHPQIGAAKLAKKGPTKMRASAIR
ncbi:MAG TPA: universal stress protein [Candidatus Udaeobacter sp.]|jgi:nucleotide-binding universal stress UspA family protein|nr:universal stress protein [Candidatus Udaeobacter sp.]